MCVQVATFLLDDEAAADVSSALARSLRIAVRSRVLGSWAVPSLPAAYTDQGHTSCCPFTHIKPVLEVLSTMKDYALAEVLQHLHLSELLHCPQSLQQAGLATHLQGGVLNLSKKLAWHPRSKGGFPPPTASFFNQYAQHIRALKVRSRPLINAHSTAMETCSPG